MQDKSYTNGVIGLSFNGIIAVEAGYHLMSVILGLGYYNLFGCHYFWIQFGPFRLGLKLQWPKK